ncbi:bh protein [Paenibacillus alkalitolerans]|uniref:bh protein n=1 Tax=Paenibacillus alkalitolerans TaxID=2799335 RepID=UPI0018F4CB2C|nr:bh protein [Paenibacillus alkalitolerans]
MKETKLEAELFCPRCSNNTIHQITYLNSKISSIECEACNRNTKVRVDAKGELYNELLNRVITKPSRITKEYREDLGRFLRSFPKRLSSKPFRLMREAKHVLKVLEKYNKNTK